MSPDGASRHIGFHRPVGIKGTISKARCWIAAAIFLRSSVTAYRKNISGVINAPALMMDLAASYQ